MIGFLFSENPKKAGSRDQSTLQAFLLYHNLWKVASVKNLFSSLHVFGTTCFGKCFLFNMTTRRHCFFLFFWSFSLPRDSFQPSRSCFLWNKWFERSASTTASTMLRIHSTSTMLIPDFQNWRSRISYLLIFLNFFYFLMLHIFLF